MVALYDLFCRCCQCSSIEDFVPNSDSFSILTSQSNTGTEHSAYDAAESSEVAQLRRGINVYTSNSPFACDLGGELPELTVAYEACPCVGSTYSAPSSFRLATRSVRSRARMSFPSTISRLRTC